MFDNSDLEIIFFYQFFNIFFFFRAIRRQSLSEIGFGRLDTYTKLDKLGEVRIF